MNKYLAPLGPQALGIIVVCQGSRAIAPIPSPMPAPPFAQGFRGLEPNPSPMPRPF